MIATQVLTLAGKYTKKDILFSIIQVIGASLFLALCAQISIPLYFTPVPLTGQTFAVMLIGATLGSRKGLLTVFAYLVEGGLGLPFFAAGAWGYNWFLGATGGYFVGFLFQAYIVGWFMERKESFPTYNILPILLLSCAVQLGLGVLWLSPMVGFQTALVLGLLPFLPGEIMKAMGIAAYLKKAA